MDSRDKPATPTPQSNVLAIQWERYLPLLLVGVLISLVSVFVMQMWGGAERIRVLVAGAGAWAPLVFILLKASTYVIAPLSGTPLKIAAGALFGVWDGLLYTMAGDVLGGSLNFWIARLLGRPGIRRFAGAKAIAQVDETVEHAGGWRALLAARLVLSAVYDFISYAAGLSNLPFRQYLWVTVVGGVPAGLMYVFIGDALTRGPAVLYILGGLAVVMGVGVWMQRRAKSGR
jgi:uncharacterized membrane protein YdjX (TVP38/TMEM64 family)